MRAKIRNENPIETTTGQIKYVTRALKNQLLFRLNTEREP